MIIQGTTWKIKVGLVGYVDKVALTTTPSIPVYKTFWQFRYIAFTMTQNLDTLLLL